MQHFNIDEILKIAIKIEKNGRAFYLKAASLLPEHEEWLTRLADEEIAHENVFAMFARSFVQKDNLDPEYIDSEDLAASYLHSIADSIIFNLAKEPSESFAENPTIDDIIKDALNREQESILFYTGIKMAMRDPKTAQEIELIIREEMSHVAWLKQKQLEIQEGDNKPKPDKVYEVAIIGGGPGGISMAAELAERGLDPSDILILEGAPKTSWMIRKLYPEQKMVTANYKGNPGDCYGVMKMRDMTKTSTLQMLADTVDDYGLTIHYEHPVQKIDKIKNEFHVHTTEQVFKARFCIIAIGVFGKPNKPDYKIPKGLHSKTHFDITSSSIENQDVLVVGGGDSAAEYVQFLLEKGNSLSLSSRETDLSYMNEENRRRTQTLAVSETIKLYAGSDVDSIEDEDGKIRVIFKSNTPKTIVVDQIVYALGGSTPLDFLKFSNIKIDGDQPTINDHHESSVQGLYLTGDLAARGKFGAIATAFNASNDIATDLAPKLNIKMKV